MDINILFDEFQKLSPVVQNMFFNLIYPLVKNSSDRVNDYIETIRETRFSKGTFCPHCNSEHIIGHGKYRSRQRYKCKDCGKTFNDVSCSPMAGTHYPQKWAKYFQFISEGTTLPKIAKALNISISTAFYWRHKVLNSLRSMDIEQLSGIIESDETFFIEPFKGKNQCKTRKPNKRGGKSKFRGISHEQVCILVAMDRNGHIISRNAGMGRITATQIDNVIGNYIAPNALLISDSAKNYLSFAKMKGLEHKQVNASKKQYVIEKLYHMQHVNEYHKRLGKWINLHFNGVSTKYMDNYLFWHRFLELNKSLDKVELKKTLLTNVLAMNKSIIIKDLHPINVL
ncbi:IS1595 family transposase [Clostridium beijerinckii]|uniref:IS1595 family transposase n=1 Tax=Clostridium beijerinckii TaxID=1520 RepID=UPI000687D078